MAALGLICVFASGGCWAQQSTSSTNEAGGKPKAQAKAAPSKAVAKPVAKKTASKKTEAKKAESKKHEKKDDAKAETKADAQSEAKPVEKLASARPDTKPADGKADVAPPAGTMMGAYGQSLMRAPAGAATTGATAAAATTLAAAGTTALLAPTATPASITNASLPPTALMGAAAGNANASDSIARFLQQRGIVAQAQQASAMPDSPAPGLLNQLRDKSSDLVLSAMNFLGVPYKRGGNSVNNGFDCSGFTRHIFEMSVGLVLPRRADEQAKLSSLVPIKKEDLKPGDLVFFNTMRATFSHVGIYVGEGKFIHSPRVGGAVRVEDMREAYWAKRFTGARRADLNQANPGT